MPKTTLTVPKIKCEGCAQTITQALTPMAGVEQVQVDVDQKKVTVSYTESSTLGVGEITAKLAEAGFPPA